MAWVDDLVAHCERCMSEETREELWSRGADNAQIDLYRIGYLEGEAPDVGYEPFSKWFRHWHKEGRMGKQIVLPLTNALGEVKGVQFRALERERKGYIDYFAESAEPVYFGLGQAIPHAWKEGSIWLVEGAFDLFPIQRHFPNVMPTLTAKVSDSLARMLRRFVKKVIIAYDRDATGRRGAEHFRADYGSDFETAVVEFPPVVKVDGSEAKDPGDYWEAWGDDQLGAFLRDQLGAFLRCSVAEETTNAPKLFYC